MRHLSDIPANRGSLREVDFAKTPARGAVSGKTSFVFFYLMRNYWEGFGF
jgi:hypothetical protein